jgi:hypothetical protein
MDEIFHDSMLLKALFTESKRTLYVNVMPVCVVDLRTDFYKIQYLQQNFHRQIWF